MVDILLLAMFIVGWVLCLRIHRHQKQKETLYPVIFMTITLVGYVCVQLVTAWPGINSEQRAIIYGSAALASFLSAAVLIGIRLRFDYLDRRGRNDR